MPEMMKIINERQTQKQQQQQQTNKETKTKRNKGTKAIVKWWKLNDFVVHLSWAFSY